MANPFLYRYRYKVLFSGAFPMDMLRHDCAFPADSHSASLIQQSCNPEIVAMDRKEGRGRYLVELIGLMTPTCGRWASFGPVSVDQNSIERISVG